MSKKDYQAIARALYAVNTAQDIPPSMVKPFPSPGELMARVQNAVAYALAKDNPRFDRDRFIEACETGTTRGMRKVSA